MREAFKIRELEEKFLEFSEKAKNNFDEMKMQFRPENIQKELVELFNDVSQNLEQLAEDFEEWDGQNQQVRPHLFFHSGQKKNKYC